MTGTALYTEPPGSDSRYRTVAYQRVWVPDYNGTQEAGFRRRDRQLSSSGTHGTDEARTFSTRLQADEVWHFCARIKACGVGKPAVTLGIH